MFIIGPSILPCGKGVEVLSLEESLYKLFPHSDTLICCSPLPPFPPYIYPPRSIFLFVSDSVMEGKRERERARARVRVSLGPHGRQGSEAERAAAKVDLRCKARCWVVPRRNKDGRVSSLLLLFPPGLKIDAGRVCVCVYIHERGMQEGTHARGDGQDSTKNARWPHRIDNPHRVRCSRQCRPPPPPRPHPHPHPQGMDTDGCAQKVGRQAGPRPGWPGHGRGAYLPDQGGQRGYLPHVFPLAPIFLLLLMPTPRRLSWKKKINLPAAVGDSHVSGLVGCSMRVCAGLRREGGQGGAIDRPWGACLARHPFPSRQGRGYKARSVLITAHHGTAASLPWNL